MILATSSFTNFWDRMRGKSIAHLSECAHGRLQNCLSSMTMRGRDMQRKRRKWRGDNVSDASVSHNEEIISYTSSYDWPCSITLCPCYGPRPHHMVLNMAGVSLWRRAARGTGRTLSFWVINIWSGSFTLDFRLEREVQNNACFRQLHLIFFLTPPSTTLYNLIGLE